MSVLSRVEAVDNFSAEFLGVECNFPPRFFNVFSCFSFSKCLLRAKSSVLLSEKLWC
jgi:hypothetical protein